MIGIQEVADELAFAEQQMTECAEALQKLEQEHENAVKAYTREKNSLAQKGIEYQGAITSLKRVLAQNNGKESPPVEE